MPTRKLIKITGSKFTKVETLLEVRTVKVDLGEYQPLLLHVKLVNLAPNQVEFVQGNIITIDLSK